MSASDVEDCLVKLGHGDLTLSSSDEEEVPNFTVGGSSSSSSLPLDSSVRRALSGSPPPQWTPEDDEYGNFNLPQSIHLPQLRHPEYLPTLNLAGIHSDKKVGVSAEHVTLGVTDEDVQHNSHEKDWEGDRTQDNPEECNTDGAYQVDFNRGGSANENVEKFAERIISPDLRDISPELRADYRSDDELALSDSDDSGEEHGSDNSGEHHNKHEPVHEICVNQSGEQDRGRKLVEGQHLETPELEIKTRTRNHSQSETHPTQSGNEERKYDLDEEYPDTDDKESPQTVIKPSIKFSNAMMSGVHSDNIMDTSEKILNTSEKIINATIIKESYDLEIGFGAGFGSTSKDLRCDFNSLMDLPLGSPFDIGSADDIRDVVSDDARCSPFDMKIADEDSERTGKAVDERTKIADTTDTADKQLGFKNLTDPTAGGLFAPPARDPVRDHMSAEQTANPRDHMSAEETANPVDDDPKAQIEALKKELADAKEHHKREMDHCISEYNKLDLLSKSAWDDQQTKINELQDELEKVSDFVSKGNNSDEILQAEHREALAEMHGQYSQNVQQIEENFTKRYAELTHDRNAWRAECGKWKDEQAKLHLRVAGLTSQNAREKAEWQEEKKQLLVEWDEKKMAWAKEKEAWEREREAWGKEKEVWEAILADERSTNSDEAARRQKELEERVAKLKDEVAKSSIEQEASRSKADTKLREARADLEAVTEKHSHLESTLTNAQSELESTRSELESTRSELENTRCELDKSRSTVSQMKADNVDNISRLDMLTADNNAQNAKLAAAEKEHARKVKKLRDEKAEELTKVREEKEAELSNLREEKNEEINTLKKEQLEQIKQIMDQKSEELRTLKEEKLQVMDQKASLQIENNKLGSQMEQLREEITRAEKAVVQLQQELNENGDALKQSRRGVLELQRNIHIYTVEKAELEKACDEYRAKCTAAELNCSTLRNEATNYEKENTLLRNEIHAKIQEVEKRKPFALDIATQTSDCDVAMVAAMIDTDGGTECGSRAGNGGIGSANYGGSGTNGSRKWGNVVNQEDQFYAEFRQFVRTEPAKIVEYYPGLMAGDLCGTYGQSLAWLLTERQKYLKHYEVLTLLTNTLEVGEEEGYFGYRENSSHNNINAMASTPQNKSSSNGSTPGSDRKLESRIERELFEKAGFNAGVANTSHRVSPQAGDLDDVKDVMRNFFATIGQSPPKNGAFGTPPRRASQSLNQSHSRLDIGTSTGSARGTGRVMEAGWIGISKMGKTIPGNRNPDQLWSDMLLLQDSIIETQKTCINDLQKTMAASKRRVKLLEDFKAGKEVEAYVKEMTNAHNRIDVLEKQLKLLPSKLKEEYALKLVEENITTERLVERLREPIARDRVLDADRFPGSDRERSLGGRSRGRTGSDHVLEQHRRRSTSFSEHSSPSSLSVAGGIPPTISRQESHMSRQCGGRQHDSREQMNQHDDAAGGGRQGGRSFFYYDLDAKRHQIAERIAFKLSYSFIAEQYEECQKGRECAEAKLQEALSQLREAELSLGQLSLARRGQKSYNNSYAQSYTSTAVSTYAKAQRTTSTMSANQPRRSGTSTVPVRRSDICFDSDSIHNKDVTSHLIGLDTLVSQKKKHVPKRR